MALPVTALHGGNLAYTCTTRPWTLHNAGLSLHPHAQVEETLQPQIRAPGEDLASQCLEGPCDPEASLPWGGPCLAPLPWVGDWESWFLPHPGDIALPLLIIAPSGLLLPCSSHRGHVSCLTHRGDLLKALKSLRADRDVTLAHAELLNEDEFDVEAGDPEGSTPHHTTPCCIGCQVCTRQV